jgi:hypothetical protein
MHFDEVFLPVESGSLVDRPQWQGIDDPKPNGVSLCGLSAAKSLKRKIWTIGTTILFVRCVAFGRLPGSGTWRNPFLLSLKSWEVDLDPNQISRGCSGSPLVIRWPMSA